MALSGIAELSSRIREEAIRLGFSGVGIAAVRSLPYVDYFTEWLARERQGEMRYLERQAAKRGNPGLILPDSRSIIVVALNYYSADAVSGAPAKGRISRYAWGDDYHVIAVNRLESLLAFIRSLEPSARGRCYTDTGPIMEKLWGAQTALGWMGKNTNLISRNLGSWFFIGAILLDVGLEYDSKGTDYCGQCHRCIDACPTGAITAPYELDARLCISYLTIELRGPIPRSLRPLIGNRIFGCDDCQEACPWNRFAIETSDREFRPREGNLMPDLAPLSHISVDEFVERFGNSPIRRATRDGFVRNVVVALGNSGGSDAVPALEGALRDASPLVRSHAAWALGRIADGRSLRILESARAKEEHPAVLEEIELALAKP
jgi:epoxyqueuosine reductase